jgi:hypothetical protein
LAIGKPGVQAILQGLLALPDYGGVEVAQAYVHQVQTMLVGAAAQQLNFAGAEWAITVEIEG